MLFPFLNTNALRAVLSSGLWNFDDANDKEFLLAIAAYERILNVANDIVRSYNEQLARIDDDDERIAQAEQYRTTVDETNWFIRLLRDHQNVGQVVCVCETQTGSESQRTTGRE